MPLDAQTWQTRTGAGVPRADTLGLWTENGLIRIAACRPWRGRLLTVFGRRVHVLDRGTGPAIVLLHGMGSVAQEVIAPLLPLADAGWRLIAIDRPGHGGSDPSPAALAGVRHQAAVVARCLDLLGVDQAVLAGHSLGAAVAAAVAVDRPSRCLALVSVAGFILPTRPKFKPVLRTLTLPGLGVPLRHSLLPGLGRRLAPGMVRSLFAPNPVPDSFDGFPIDQAARPHTVETMARELKTFNRSVVPLLTGLQRLDRPALVVMGAEDRVVDPVRQGAGLAALLPEANLMWLEGIGHIPHHICSDQVATAVARIARAALPGRGAG